MTTEPTNQRPEITHLDAVLPKINRETVLDLVRKRPDRAADIMLALLAQNTDALPGTVFVRRGEKLELMKVRSSVRLSTEDKTILLMGYGEARSVNISIHGYRRLNEVAGLQIIRPTWVVVNGQKQMNPYIQVDPVSKITEVVYARCLAVGYSPMGSLVATDATIRLDLGVYFIENIIAKLKKHKNDDRAAEFAVYGIKEERPADLAAVGNSKARKSVWAFTPIHSVSGMGIWVNMAAPDAGDVLADHITRCKFADRLAPAFAERNALKSHPGIPKVVRADAHGVASVKVGGWTTDFTRADIDKLRELIEHDKLDEFRHGDGKSISVVATVDDATEEDAGALDVEVASEFDVGDGGGDDDGGESGGDGSDDGAERAANRDDLMTEAVDLYSGLSEEVGRTEAKRFLRGCGVSGNLEEATDEQLQAFLTEARKRRA